MTDPIREAFERAYINICGKDPSEIAESLSRDPDENDRYLYGYADSCWTWYQQGRADLLAEQRAAEPLQALAAKIIAEQKPMPANMAAILARNMHRLYNADDDRSGSSENPNPDRSGAGNHESGMASEDAEGSVSARIDDHPPAQPAITDEEIMTLAEKHEVACKDAFAESYFSPWVEEYNTKPHVIAFARALLERKP